MELQTGGYGETILSQQNCLLVYMMAKNISKNLYLWLVASSEPADDTSHRQCISPTSPADCSMCFTGLEDYSHPFFECPVTQAAWAAQNTQWVVTSLAESFWDSLRRGAPKPVMECGRLFKVLKVIWLHSNEVIFQVSAEGIIHMVEALVSCGLRGAWLIKESLLRLRL